MTMVECCGTAGYDIIVQNKNTRAASNVGMKNRSGTSDTVSTPGENTQRKLHLIRMDIFKLIFFGVDCALFFPHPLGPIRFKF